MKFGQLRITPSVVRCLVSCIVLGQLFDTLSVGYFSVSCVKSKQCEVRRSTRVRDVQCVSYKGMIKCSR